MFEKFTNSFSHIDKYGIPYNINFNKKFRHTSSCGGILSVGTVLGFIIALWLFGKEIIYRENPNVTNTIYVDPNYYPRNMTVPIAFIMEDSFRATIDDFSRFVTLTAYLINYSTSKDIITSTNVTIPIRNCKSEDFSDDLFVQESFKSNALVEALCFESLSQTVSGNWQNLKNDYILITLTPCVNTTVKNNSCYSNASISNFRRFYFKC